MVLVQVLYLHLIAPSVLANRIYKFTFTKSHKNNNNNNNNKDNNNNNF